MAHRTETREALADLTDSAAVLPIRNALAHDLRHLESELAEDGMPYRRILVQVDDSEPAPLLLAHPNRAPR